MPARDGNRSPRDDRSWGSRAKDFVICAEAACIDRLPYCNRGAVEVSWLYCCSYRGPIAQRKGMGIVEVVECVSVNSTLGAMCLYLHSSCEWRLHSWAPQAGSGRPRALRLSGSQNALGRAEPAGGGSGAISSARAYDLAPFWRIIVSFA